MKSNVQVPQHIALCLSHIDLFRQDPSTHCSLLITYSPMFIECSSFQSYNDRISNCSKIQFFTDFIHLTSMNEIDGSSIHVFGYQFGGFNLPKDIFSILWKLPKETYVWWTENNVWWLRLTWTTRHKADKVMGSCLKRRICDEKRPICDEKRCTCDERRPICDDWDLF